MDTSYIILISIAVAILFIILQRTEKTKRRMTWSVIIVCLLVIRHNAFLRGDLHEETLLGVIGGIIISGLFWALIGKYNPAGTSDGIKVIGMDD